MRAMIRLLAKVWLRGWRSGRSPVGQAQTQPARVAKRPGEPGLFEIGRPYWAGAGCVVSAGGVASGVAGCVVSAGGVVLWVVVLSAVSLQAAMPKRAIADAEAKINFFITVSS